MRAPPQSPALQPALRDGSHAERGGLEAPLRRREIVYDANALYRIILRSIDSVSVEWGRVVRIRLLAGVGGTPIAML